MKRFLLLHILSYSPHKTYTSTHIHTHTNGYACIFLALSHAYALLKMCTLFPTNERRKEVERREGEETVTTMNRTNGRAQSVSLCVFVALLLSQSMRHTHAQAKASVCVWERNCTVGRNRKFSIFSSFGESNKWVAPHIHTHVREFWCACVCLIFYRKRKLIRKSTVVGTLGSFGRGKKKERERECVIAVHTWRVAV